MAYINTRIKLLQYITVAIDSGNSIGTQAITGVHLGKTILHKLGETMSHGGGGGQPTLSNTTRISLTNSTTVTATRANGQNSAGSAIDGVVGVLVEERYS